MAEIVKEKYSGGTFIKSREEEWLEFLSDHPRYALTGRLDALRSHDYSILDQQGHTYLDFTGAGLYGRRQIEAHSHFLLHNVLGNPHSSNPTSQAMTDLVEKVRLSVLDFVHADPKEYVCIFTQNASGALKLIGESFPFEEGSQYLLTYDNHNSVNGIREFARARGAKINYLPIELPEMRINGEELVSRLSSINNSTANLFAYPAQSNFSGVQHSLEWIAKAQKLGWSVLLDAAAFLPTNELDLSLVHPDFVVCSFYKLFGYPTGVGALIARREALAALKRPWFAGGTITVASVKSDRYYLHLGSEGFEDGTLNFLSLPSVEFGLNHIRELGYTMIHERVMDLTDWLIHKLSGLRHASGLPLIKIYGPLETLHRGATLAMNFFDQEGHFIDHKKIELAANNQKISIRTGCFCNPGDGELALGFTENELTACFSSKQRMEYEDFRRCLDDKSTGAVRISLGLISNFADVYKIVSLCTDFLNKSHLEI
ncbi:MAG: aminotransferase class V-fold PLP-dependent enzyme [Anaerolineaceae bacterium]|nr:aminotransferase class V-fold PLP-dependent enzyme [Anaerolineaceae bacterium]